MAVSKARRGAYLADCWRGLWILFVGVPLCYGTDNSVLARRLSSTPNVLEGIVCQTCPREVVGELRMTRSQLTRA
jgi:hypothetical protein